MKDLLQRIEEIETSMEGPEGLKNATDIALIRKKVTQKDELKANLKKKSLKLL